MCKMDDAKRRKEVPIEKINMFAPFCHATSSYHAEVIDREGLKPRKWRHERRESIYEGEMQSKEDRVYFASVERKYGACFDALETAYNELPYQAWSDGVFYILEEIPAEYRDKLTIDEDCKGMARVLDKECKTALDSLDIIGTLGIKRQIPRAKLKKMTPKAFYHLIRRFHPALPEWNIFVTDKLCGEMRNVCLLPRDRQFAWVKEHYPHLLEE